MHQIIKQLSHPNLHRHHIQGGVLQSIAKAIRQSPLPILSTIEYHVKQHHAGITGNEYGDALARNSITTYSDVADTSIKTAGPGGNPFYYIYRLAKNMKNTNSYKINQTQPSHLP